MSKSIKPIWQYLLGPGCLPSSLSSGFLVAVTFSALSRSALSATLRNTFPWASFMNWTSWRMSQYRPWAGRGWQSESEWTPQPSGWITRAVRKRVVFLLHKKKIKNICGVQERAPACEWVASGPAPERSWSWKSVSSAANVPRPFRCRCVFRLIHEGCLTYWITV